MGQVLQYETSSCFVEGKCKYEQYHESYLKIDGGRLSKEEMKESNARFSTMSSHGHELSRFGKEADDWKKKLLDGSHGSLKSVKDERRNSVDKSLRKMLPSINFNEKIIASQSQIRKSVVYRLSVKRTSSDAEECKLCSCLNILVSNTHICFAYAYAYADSSKQFLYRARAGYEIPCSKDEKANRGCWSHIPSSKFQLRGDTYFK